MSDTTMMDTLNSPSDNGPSRKRLRTSHACDVCRSRKIRCDGNNPCTACKASDTECTYGSEANSRGKSDLILEGVLRVEKLLQDMGASLSSTSSPIIFTHPNTQSLLSPIVASSTTRGRGSFSYSPTEAAHLYPQNQHHQNHQPQQPAQHVPQRTPPRSTTTAADHLPLAGNLENAVLDSMHTSTTESVLQWPHFDLFPSLRNDYISIFHLEQSRPPFRTRANTMCPYASAAEVDAVLAAFSHGVNFWYPTVSRAQMGVIRAAVLGEDESLGDETGRCLALLTMALGCAGQVIGGLTEVEMDDEERERRRARRTVGDMYFDCAMRMLHVALTDVSPVATHCLLFVALYFAFLRRPLQAGTYINAAAAKCLLLLSYPPTHSTPEDTERIRRIFWSCYILESDYLAELSVPLSGVGRIESSIPLPGNYHTHSTPQEEEQSSLYFLACISMRRLLNRVHQLLYARDTGACESLDDARFPVVVAELDHQLEEWRDVLPAAFAFDVELDSSENRTRRSEHGGFLRQRYLTCRSVIYRPYLMWMLSGAGDGDRSGIGIGGGPRVSEEVLGNCKACLDACLLHILHLRGFAHTVLVDTWICSLSMAAAMLILLAACRMPTLRSLIGPEVLAAGNHLIQLLEGWQMVSGNPNSPSVDQSVRIIREADKFIREVYGSRRQSSGDGRRPWMVSKKA